MKNIIQSEQILFRGVDPNELLSKIEQIIDAKFSVSSKKEIQFEYWTRKETAAFLKITLPTLHDWTKRGLVKAYKMGTRVTYKSNEVRDALEKSATYKYRKGGWNA